MTKQRLLAALATLLKVYIESGNIIPELEQDLKDGAVKEIRAIIEKEKS